MTSVGVMALRMRRPLLAAGAALLALTLATACSPTPAPTPSPTGFASEEEAFAAAEATYRAYVDALNNVDLADPATFEPVYETSTGDARDAIAKELSEMHAKGWAVGGATTPTLVSLASADPSTGVELNVCSDVSKVTLIDAGGVSMVSPDRPDVQALTVVVTYNANSPLVMSISSRTGPPSC